MMGVPCSCALLGRFAIGAQVSLLWQRTVCKLIALCTANAYSAKCEMSASTCTMPGARFTDIILRIYPKTCHKIILWQKLRCHKMILRHILSKFTKFVLGDRKIWRVTMVTMTFVYNCVYVTGTRTHFTCSFRCLPASVPPFHQPHINSTVLPLMLHHPRGNLQAALISCSTTCTRSSAALLYVYTVRSFTLVTVMFYCSLVFLSDM